MDKTLDQSKTLVSKLLRNAVTDHNSGNLRSAKQQYEKILKSHPNNFDSLHLLGVLMGQNNEVSIGIALIEKSIAIKPNFPEAIYNLGVLYQQEEQSNKATLCFNQVVRLDPKNINAWNNLSGQLYLQGKKESAVKTLEEAIKENPNSMILYDKACRYCKRTKNYTRCLELAIQGLKKSPTEIKLWIHRAEVCFVLGKFPEGWASYEWRHKEPENPNKPPKLNIPFWQGQSLRNSNILVWTEQGPGETLLFSSMLPELIDLAKSVIVLTTQRLQPILQRSFPKAEIISNKALRTYIKKADLQCSLVDSGRWLKASWKDFSPSKKGHIKSNHELIKFYRNLHKSNSKSTYLVGIAWRSFDVNTTQNKSLTLEKLLPILSIPGVKFVSMQYGSIEQEIREFKETTGITIFKSQACPISELELHLAEIASMDLVISSSNTAAHAAAAQNIPVWCLIPHTLGEGLRWQWFTNRSSSPWYSSLHLYRQKTDGDWRQPISQIAIDLFDQKKPQGTKSQKSKFFLRMAIDYYTSGDTETAFTMAKVSLKNGQCKEIGYRILAATVIEEKDQPLVLRALGKAIQTIDEPIDLLLDRARLNRNMGYYEEAITDLKRVLNFNSQKVEALNNLGNTLRQIGKTPEALKYYRKAAKINPLIPSLNISLSTCLYEMNKNLESEKLLKKIELQQNVSNQAKLALGINYLLNGNLKKGWRLYQHRLYSPNSMISFNNFPFPKWTGQNITKKHVLIWTEQGIGEEILLSTCIKELNELCSSLTLLCSERLISVFRRSFQNITIAAREEPLSANALNTKIDVQMSLSEVGAILRPTLQHFPTEPLCQTLIADRKRVNELRNCYQRQTGRSLLIGLSWSSLSDDLGPAKTIQPKQFESIIKNVDATFVSLQYSPKMQDLSVFDSIQKEKWIYDPSVNPVTDMEDSVAQIAAMDFVITISNTTAHTAGALGIPTALLVPKFSGRHWYWHRGQNHSNWYPCVQIYEKDDKNSWTNAIVKINSNIQKLICA